MNNLLEKAFEIAQNSQFKVKIYFMDDDDTKEFREMTYMELGTYLIANSSKIKNIDIIFKESE